MGSMRAAFTGLLFSLIIPVVGVALITAFATGTSTGETLIKSVGPLVLWLLPLIAVIIIITKMFQGE
jgi:hypothetical protein